MVSKKFKTWFLELNPAAQHRSIKDFAVNLNKSHKAMVLAHQRELEFGLNRLGIRGGKFTTLSARSQTATRIYLELVDELKFMVSII